MRPSSLPTLIGRWSAVYFIDHSLTPLETRTGHRTLGPSPGPAGWTRAAPIWMHQQSFPLTTGISGCTATGACSTPVTVLSAVELVPLVGQGTTGKLATPAQSVLSVVSPLRLGYEPAGVHEAELAAMLAALRWRRSDGWNLLVVDRSSLCTALQQANLQRPAALLTLQVSFWWAGYRGSCKIYAALGTNPHRSPLGDYNKKPSQRSGTANIRNKWMCKTTHCTAGLVAVDIKSHQQHSAIPHPVITRGNELQDEGCSLGRNLMRPPDVLYPTGGFFAFLVTDGKAIGSPIRKVVRALLRTQASQQWKQRKVQGHVATQAHEVFGPALDMRLFTHVSVPSPWTHWLLPSDPRDGLDLSKFLYRCVRAVAAPGPKASNPTQNWLGWQRTGQILTSSSPCGHARCALQVPALPDIRL